MNSQEAIVLLRNLEDSLDSYCELNEEGKTAFRMAIEALSCSEIPNNSDTISRQQAIDTLKELTANGTNKGMVFGEDAVHRIEMLPSVQSERKTGRWLPDNTDYYRTRFICSECGESEEVPTTGFGYGTMWDYCPMCGAKMEGERKE